MHIYILFHVPILDIIISLHVSYHANICKIIAKPKVDLEKVGFAGIWSLKKKKKVFDSYIFDLMIDLDQECPNYSTKFHVAADFYSNQSGNCRQMVES